MLRTDLIDQVNSGNLWVLVGSGASADAGLPAWSGLAASLEDRLETAKREALSGNRLADRADREGMQRTDALRGPIDRGRCDEPRRATGTSTARRGFAHMRIVLVMALPEYRARIHHFAALYTLARSHGALHRLDTESDRRGTGIEELKGRVFPSLRAAIRLGQGWWFRHEPARTR